MDLPTATVIVGGITAIGSGVSAYIAYLAKKHAQETNDAVNHRHQNGTPRVYDMLLDVFNHVGDIREKVGELHVWQKSYQGGPLDTGAKVIEFVNETEERFTKIHGKLDNLERVIVDSACQVSPKSLERRELGPLDNRDKGCDNA